jgi:cytochrome c oxidase assembly protein subunit 15
MTGLPHAVSYADISRSPGRAWPTRSRLTAAWLFAVAAIVIGMVVVGGATRLTGSGLSITDWKPVSGALPPMSDAAWADLFRRYRAIPQYRIVNPDMTLAGFKTIFWWEWSHRLLGRLLGVVFAAPLVALLLTRRLPRRLAWPCVGLFVLGGLQGLVGWWMVASGLETRIYVAPERLAAHLGLALFLFVALILTGLEAGWGGQGRSASAPRGTRVVTVAFALGVYLQCLMGALVAGNHAGLANADWPLMSGRLIPDDYWQAGGLWTTLAHGLAAVQFNHRLLAYGLAAFAVALAVGSRRAPRLVRRLSLMVVVIVGAQVALGVGLLLFGVPLWAALAHQLTACGLLATATVLAWATRMRYYDTIG